MPMLEHQPSKVQTKTQRLREKLYMLQGSKCFYCSRSIPMDERTLEHIVPASDNGNADCDNGVVVCQKINQLLGAATPKQKMQMLKDGGGRIECPNKEQRGQCIGPKPDEKFVEAPRPDAHKEENHPTPQEKPRKGRNTTVLPRRGGAGPRQ